MIDGVDSNRVLRVCAMAVNSPAIPVVESPRRPPITPPLPGLATSPFNTVDTRLVRLGRPSSANCTPPTIASFSTAPNCTDRSENPSTDISKITASTSTCVGRRSRC